MDRQILYFTAHEQELTVLEPIKISSNKVNYIEARFALGDNWDGFDSVRAVWFTDFNCISTVLDSNGAVYVPFEVMKRKGCVRVNLVGSISENNVLTDRLTTYPVVAVVVDCTAQITGSETSPITPSQFEQFAENVKHDADRAEQGASDAQSYASDAQGYASDAQGYAQTAKGHSDDAKGYADNAKDSADNAHSSEVNAKASEDAAAISAERAEQAAADGGWMEFYIDENGHLIMEHTNNVDQVDFELVDGHLIMEVA